MKKDILYNAINNFNINSNLKLIIKEVLDYTKDNGYDGSLSLKNKLNEFNLEFQIRRRLTFSKLATLDEYFTRQNNLILISDYIPKKLKIYLKDKNISYIDGAGNAFITKNEELFIYLETNNSSRIIFNKSNRAFSKSGLKVLFQILNDESIINTPYRNIGQLSSVSIDTVSKVFKELLADKYLIRIKGNEYKIQNKERLFQEWVTVFNRVLRPKLKQQNFRTRGTKLAELINYTSHESIGGELGGEILSNYLIAENAIIYTKKSFIDTAKHFNLIPSKNGSITIMEKFWNNEIINLENLTVSPILIYADLLSNPTPRNLETAQIIYNKYVKITL